MQPHEHVGLVDEKSGLNDGTGTIPMIDGGSTTDDRSPPIEVQGPFDVEKHRGVLTLLLILLLSVVIVGHYVCLFVLEWNGKYSGPQISDQAIS